MAIVVYRIPQEERGTAAHLADALLGQSGKPLRVRADAAEGEPLELDLPPEIRGLLQFAARCLADDGIVAIATGPDARRRTGP